MLKKGACPEFIKIYPLGKNVKMQKRTANIHSNNMWHNGRNIWGYSVEGYWAKGGVIFDKMSNTKIWA
jgi:hypothetical protein